MNADAGHAKSVARATNRLLAFDIDRILAAECAVLRPERTVLQRRDIVVG